jgi:hypothetical protein
LHFWGVRDARFLDPMPAPQPVACVLDDLTEQFLPSDRGTGVAPRHLGEERRREVGGVIGGREIDGHGRFVRDDLFQKLRCARRRRHADARRIAEAERKLQHVPRPFRAAPFRKLVAPRGRELRAA